MFDLIAIAAILHFIVYIQQRDLYDPECPRVFIWITPFLATTVAILVTLNNPPVVRMLCICAAILYSMKGVVLYETQVKLDLKSFLMFFTFWPGMDPKPFTRRGRCRWLANEKLRTSGMWCMVAGLLLCMAANNLMMEGTVKQCTMMSTPLLLVGISLFFHFGLFTLQTAVLVQLGYPVCRPFRNPLRSKSLKDFWSNRWNRPFVEMTKVAVFNPLKSLGIESAWCVWIVFIFSGFLHELAITVPVHAGYGYPLWYFFINGCGMLIEESIRREGQFDFYGVMQITEPPSFGWTAVFVLAPFPVLFPDPFLKEVAWILVK